MAAAAGATSTDSRWKWSAASRHVLIEAMTESEFDRASALSDKAALVERLQAQLYALYDPDRTNAGIAKITYRSLLRSWRIHNPARRESRERDRTSMASALRDKAAALTSKSKGLLKRAKKLECALTHEAVPTRFESESAAAESAGSAALIEMGTPDYRQTSDGELPDGPPSRAESASARGHDHAPSLAPEPPSPPAPELPVIWPPTLRKAPPQTPAPQSQRKVGPARMRPPLPPPQPQPPPPAKLMVPPPSLLVRRAPVSQAAAAAAAASRKRSRAAAGLDDAPPAARPPPAIRAGGW